MKKIIPILLILLTFGCNIDYQFPERVGIKTQAEYYFTVANIKQDFSEYISAESLQNLMNQTIPSQSIIQQNLYNAEITESSKFKLYDYNPNNKTEPNISQKYIAEMKLQEIPINVGDYLNNMDFSTQLREMTFDQSIEVPAFPTFNDIQSVEIPDLNKEIRNSAEINVDSIIIPEGINGEMTTPIDITINITKPDFEIIEFTQGNLVLDIVAQNDPTNNFSSLISVVLKNSSDEIISESEPTVLSATGKVLIPLTNKKITQTMKLAVTGSSTGGTLGEFVTYNISTSLDNNTKVKRAVGLTLDLGENKKIPIEQTVTIGTNESFINCTIDEGYITMKSALPANWTGIDFDTSITISGGLVATDSDFNTENENLPYILNRSLDLKDRVYAKEQIFVNGYVTVELNNATIYLDSDINTLEVQTICDIKTAKDITIDLENNQDFEANKNLLSFTKNEAFPESVKTYVTSMTLNESGLKIKYTNTLPEENDISFKTTSNILSISKTSTLQCNKTNENIEITNDQEHVIDISSAEFLDFSIDLGLPGTTPEKPYYVVLKNIEFGKNYQIKIEVLPVFDWKEITIKTSATTIQNSLDTNFNLSSMFNGLTEKLGDNSLVEKINISSLPLYLFCSKPNIQSLNDMEFQGEINITSGSLEPIQILSPGEKISFEDSPNMEILENGTVISDLSKLSATNPIDISPLLNSRDNNPDSTLKVNYSISLLDSTGNPGEIRIKREDLENYENINSSSISIAARLVIPLELEITDDLDINLMNIINANKTEEEKQAAEASGNDIFNRTEPTNLSDVEKYMNIIKSCEVIYNTKNNLLKFKDRSLQPQLIFDTKIDSIEPYSLGLESSKIKFYTEDVKTVFQTYPFNPEILIQVPKGELYIPRQANIEMALSLGIETDGTLILFGD